VTSTVTRPDAISARVRTRGRRARPRRRLPLGPVSIGLLVVVLVVSVYLVWLVSGLLSASRIVQDKAAVAQTELQLFRDTLKAGDETHAKAHLAAGEAALAAARAAPGRPQVRTAKGLPYVGSTVADLDRLLRAATILTKSGHDALRIYDNFSGADSKLFKNGRFSLPAIAAAQKSVDAIVASVHDAKAVLDQVTGKGPKGDQALEKKRSALKQISSLQSEIGSLKPLLDTLPTLVGAAGRKTYLVAIMNPSEMRASGGAPLSVAFIRFNKGAMSVPLKGATSALTNLNSAHVWNRLAGRRDPFQLPAGEPQRFVNTTVNPSFDISGEQMVRATPANFGIKTDGVIALDLTALGHLLDLTGPIQTQFYGKITGQNIAKKLVVKAYTLGSDDASVQIRHNVNDELMTTMLSRLTEGGGLVAKARALGLAIPGRHLQLYFRNTDLQHLVVEKGMGGTIPVRTYGNLSAVYTQNGNASKMDVFQRRTVQETVRLRADGSAVVTRTVRLENPTPPYTGATRDSHIGYETRWAKNLIINLMPVGAKVTKAATGDDLPLARTGVDQVGHVYSQAVTMLPPDTSSSVSWTYVVPHAAIVQGNRMSFLDYVVPQSMLQVPQLELTVVPPSGWTATGKGSAWTAAPRGVTASVGMDHVQVLKVRLHRTASH
jgi:hypothetical protein